MMGFMVHLIVKYGITKKPCIKLLRENDCENEYKCKIFGPTCDSQDIIENELLLPELNIGEWLYIPNMGAYTCSSWTDFNGFKKAIKYYTIITKI